MCYGGLRKFGTSDSQAASVSVKSLASIECHMEPQLVPVLLVVLTHYTDSSAGRNLLQENSSLAEVPLAMAVE